MNVLTSIRDEVAAIVAPAPKAGMIHSAANRINPSRPTIHIPLRLTATRRGEVGELVTMRFGINPRRIEIATRTGEPRTLR
ncbi:hypothetical protein LUI11_31530 [Bradyrhizobium diazoefficiens]|jgi:hypothetical protein|uniref:Uncharacterized protein n=1 Tax=Bradyrhizobium diazoefficiens SEMIA 5080 TaxID=754504 RepID=A0A837CBU3_9BRAD|nr:hypothetical protein [Bradyrhizobium diazoefficiens]APO51706.1 hypothetical protein BD122_15581 [Bradyrhizobium diazoefficiens]KGJ66468.1 hypothetical protein BJA5080_03088 [Bradyrhizobium diazoefficiens SEMIA 5080]MCD9297301.1 hypothetical protein [Bradyrhizobium diazoefficiens]MCD9812272.1 hypothetical protein [Bradyrhizobium diazoefficiens]MCD9830844.1 hypothetical protein [Bradyrhizobium diazoefficiens]